MSWIDCAYSARFSRWNVRRPGLGRASAAASSFVSSVVAERVERRRRRDARAPGGRHHAGAQLADHLLGDVGVLIRLAPDRTSRATDRPSPCRRRGTQAVLPTTARDSESERGAVCAATGRSACGNPDDAAARPDKVVKPAIAVMATPAPIRVGIGGRTPPEYYGFCPMTGPSFLWRKIDGLVSARP